MQIRYSLDEVPQVAQKLLSMFDRYKIFTFTGTLGAGKTTLIRTVLQQAGVKEVITSPTFTYVNVYTLDYDRTFYHFDLYRLKNMNDFVAAGFDEYLYAPNSWSLIEWPEVIMPLLHSHVCHCTIEYADHERLLTYTIPEL